MRFTFKTVLAVAALAAASFTTTQACSDHNHDHGHDECGLPTGHSYEMHGRRMIEHFRVGDRDFGTREAYIGEGLRCKAKEGTKEDMELAANRLADWKAKGGRRRLQADPIFVDVFIHIITDGTKGGVTESQLEQQMQVLNDSFAPDFVFTLRATDTTNNAGWYSANLDSAQEVDMKTALRQGEADDLNFYFTQSQDGSLGWATLPIGVNNNAASLLDDGVVLRFDTVPGGAFSPFNEGDTAVHETGHWLGLYHTFDNGCNEPGDLVSDTPAEASPASGCPVGRDTCAGGGEDPIFNFMDYSDDSCMNTFTDGQFTRMLSEYNASRQRFDASGNPINNDGPDEVVVTPTPPTPAPPTPAPPTPAPPTPAPPTPTPPAPTAPTPTPPSPTPPSPTPPAPTAVVVPNTGGGTIVVQNSGSVPSPTPLVVQNSGSVPTSPTAGVIVVQNSEQAAAQNSGSVITESVPARDQCVGIRPDGRRCQRNRQCCSGKCSNRVCIA